MKTFLLPLFFFICFFSDAQVTFERNYQISDRDNGWEAMQTNENGYIIVGATDGGGDVLLIKTDEFGDTLWIKTFGGTSGEYGHSVQQTSDHGYIIVGETLSYGAGEYDIYLIRTDSLGHKLWQRTFGGAYHDFGKSVQITTDNGYIIAGRTSASALDDIEIIVVKTDINGNEIWTKNYGGPGMDYGETIINTNDGGYAIIGATTSFGAGEYDAYLVKIDENGDTSWTKTYGGPYTDIGNSIMQTIDNGYIIVGHTDSYGAGDVDMYLIRTNDSGDTIWTKTFGGALYDIGTSVDITNENEYIVTGYGESFSVNTGIDVYLIKYDQFGDTIWTQKFQDSFTDYANSVQQTTDGGYIIGGTTFFNSGSERGVSLIKTDENGLLLDVEDHFLKKDELIVYPNPNNGCFYIRAFSDIDYYSIYTLGGQLVINEEISTIQKTNEIRLDLKGLAQGLYILNLRSKNQTLYKKLIVR